MSVEASSADAAKYGWKAIPRDPSSTFTNTTTNNLHSPSPHSPATLPYPSTPLVEKSLAHVSQHLPKETLNHSLRVYYYGISIMTSQFPNWIESGRLDPETWMLTCLWHDWGTTHENLRKTHMSFDFWGGIQALQHLTTPAFGSTPLPQAESIAEAIIRHQDPGPTGTITSLGFLIQLATEFDNMGHYKALVHPDTIKAVVEKYPRLGWSGCFSKTIREEIELKPWAHSTAIEGFADMVERNEVMKAYD